MKAIVDPETCIGCGICCSICASVFRMNEQGKAQAYQAAAPEEESDLQAAIESCPVNAIHRDV